MRAWSHLAPFSRYCFSFQGHQSPHPVIQEHKVLIGYPEGLADFFEQTFFFYFERAVRIAESQQIDQRNEPGFAAVENTFDARQLQILGFQALFQLHFPTKLVEHALFVGIEQAIGHHNVVGQPEQGFPLFSCQ